MKIKFCADELSDPVPPGGDRRINNVGRIRSAVIPLAAILSFFSIAWLDPFRDAVSSGNREYDRQKFNNAKRYYQKAEEYAPSEDNEKKLSFNTADADYMLEDLDSALTG